MLDALVYCHRMGFFHTDLRPENLLLTTTDLNTAIVKVANLYLVKYLRCVTLSKSSSSHKVCTHQNPKLNAVENIAYTAPESLCLQKSKCDEAANIYTCGVLLFLLRSYHA